MSQSSSKKVIAIVVVLAIVVAIPVFLLTRRAKTPSDPVSRIALSSMRSDLGGLMMAEATTRQLRGRYVADPVEAGHLSSPGVTPPVIILVDSGYTATVGFKTIPELQCAVGVFARNPLDRFAKSAEIVCR